MAEALQCPACGHKHRVEMLAGAPTFECARCGRTLKTPARYVRAMAPGPPAAVGRAAGARAGSRTAVLPQVAAPTAPRRAAAAPVASRSRRRASYPRGPAWLAARFAAWLVAITLGGYVVYKAASIMHFVTKSKIIDTFTYGRYARPLVLVPIWALVTALLAHALIEGARRLLVRRAGSSPRPAPRPARARGHRGDDL